MDGFATIREEVDGLEKSMKFVISSNAQEDGILKMLEAICDVAKNESDLSDKTRDIISFISRHLY